MSAASSPSNLREGGEREFGPQLRPRRGVVAVAPLGDDARAVGLVRELGEAAARQVVRAAAVAAAAVVVVAVAVVAVTAAVAAAVAAVVAAAARAAAVVLVEERVGLVGVAARRGRGAARLLALGRVEARV